VVKDLFRYPVKSRLGEPLTEVDIGENGIIGDRAYALREASGRVVTAKKWPVLFEFSARYDASPSPGDTAPLSITLPDGRTIEPAHKSSGFREVSTLRTPAGARSSRSRNPQVAGSNPGRPPPLSRDAPVARRSLSFIDRLYPAIILRLSSRVMTSQVSTSASRLIPSSILRSSIDA
jgi:MOSC N-terminal beta barrel domain